MLSTLLGGVASIALLLPATAEAHGIVGKANLPIPVWLFSWAAAIVLVVSFVALSTLWRTPQLQEPHLRRLFAVPRALEWPPARSACSCSRWWSTAASPVRRSRWRTSR